MNLAAIDPGNAAAAGRVCYVAHFDAGELMRVLTMTWRQAQQVSLDDAPDVVVIEKPQQDGRSSRVPPRVLIDLAWNGALVAASLQPASIVEYTPNDWKGQAKKPAHHLKLWRVLSPAERLCFPPGTEERIKKGAEATARNAGKLTSYSFEAHNLLDAAALGCFHLKRIGKGGAKVR